MNLKKQLKSYLKVRFETKIYNEDIDDIIMIFWEWLGYLLKKNI